MLKAVYQSKGELTQIKLTHDDPKFRVQVWEERDGDSITLITEVVQGDSIALHYHKVPAEFTQTHTVNEVVAFEASFEDLCEIPVKSRGDASLEVCLENVPSAAMDLFTEAFLADLNASFKEAMSAVGELDVSPHFIPHKLSWGQVTGGPLSPDKLSSFYRIKFNYRGERRSPAQAIQDIFYDQGGLSGSFQVLK